MFISRLSKTLLILITIVFASVSGFAWDEIGHKLTAYIAWERMTSDARDKAFNLLLNAPEDSDLSVPYNFFNSRSEAAKRRELFMYAANWSDVVRNRNFVVRNAKYHHGNWHYADIFWKRKNGLARRLADFNGAGGVAISKLDELEKIIRNPQSPKASRAIALAWFLHVGGDVHNPVHNASRVTTLEPGGDQGGNLFTLRPQGPDGVRRINLHGYWDSIIGNYRPRKNDASDSEYLPPIARKIMKKFRFSKMQQRLKLRKYEQWNLEGFDLLSKVVYTTDIVRDRMPSKKYRKRAFRTAQEQIALAGYRLGETLNDIFDHTQQDVGTIQQRDCRIIRRILYPVSKKRIPDQKMRIALLNICPPNKGVVARPTASVSVGGKPVYYEFDVIRFFESEKEFALSFFFVHFKTM